MFVNVQLPDEVYQIYAERAPERPQKALADTLKAFAGLDPAETRLLLEGETLQELNRILGHPISTGSELLEHLRRSQRVSLGDGIEIALSPGQRARMQAQADFIKQSLNEFAANQVRAAVIKVAGA